MKQNYFMWILAGVVITMIILVIALIIFGVNLLVNSLKPISINTPAPIVNEQPVIISKTVSKFATDAGVLKLREDINKLRSDIDSVDIFEPQLSPPNIDLNIAITPAD